MDSSNDYIYINKRTLSRHIKRKVEDFFNKIPMEETNVASLVDQNNKQDFTTRNINNIDANENYERYNDQLEESFSLPSKILKFQDTDNANDKSSSLFNSESSDNTEISSLLTSTSSSSNLRTFKEHLATWAVQYVEKVKEIKAPTPPMSLTGMPSAQGTSKNKRPSEVIYSSVCKRQKISNKVSNTNSYTSHDL
ncbi:hypothetical protein HELRODRAFT_167926 [Helobdella robusta]|uniref:Uncharacterized protein n=1 Tax=Helobdella robusta TaxID=6412 RepID=T1EZZ0_HELRO|nr:hypothetical protein HELRODRAFT_167926 [Helobdella robusta]ESO10078.1 hypothetical protein HELRODRAFT_167926 [Helobdella robusta]